MLVPHRLQADHRRGQVTAPKPSLKCAHVFRLGDVSSQGVGEQGVGPASVPADQPEAKQGRNLLKVQVIERGNSSAEGYSIEKRPVSGVTFGVTF
jgi:hypothetical protein